MDFMITSVDDVSRQVHYSINKVGNKYAVRAYSDKTGRSVSRTFDELMEALMGKPASELQELYNNRDIEK